MIITDYYGKLSDDAKLIADFDLNQSHGNECWTNLVKAVKEWEESSFGMSPEDVAKKFQELEVATLTEMHAAGVPDLITKKGKWKMSKVCKSSTYRSAKSVILKALRNGQALYNLDGTVVAKTYVERAIKDKRLASGETPKDWEYFVKKAEKLIANAQAHLDDATDYAGFVGRVRDML